MLLTRIDYESYLKRESLPQAQPYDAMFSSLCADGLIGVKAGVFAAVESVSNGAGGKASPGQMDLTLTYTAGYTPGAVSRGTIKQDCPSIIVEMETPDAFSAVEDGPK